MKLAVEPGFGKVDTARFEGGFSFEDDRVRAQAAEADYVLTSGVVSLAGVDAKSGALPRVTDGEAAIEGTKVQLTLEGRKIVAEENVRSVLLAKAASGQPPSGSPAATRSSMLVADQPVFATAQSLSYDGSTRRASYKGAARLWQGDTAIQGDELMIDDATGNLSAKGQVRSTLMLETKAQPDPALARQPTIARADSLAYDEQAKKATYLRDAQVSGPQGDLRAGRIELILAETGKALGRLEAYTSVTLLDATREAVGDRLTYLDGEGRYTMEGAPVRIVSQCRDISGRTLTFFRSTDTIIVDGNQETRTQTKGGAACGERKAP
jgi:lipopolysaccharide export system protein LptA